MGRGRAGQTSEPKPLSAGIPRRPFPAFPHAKIWLSEGDTRQEKCSDDENTEIRAMEVMKTQNTDENLLIFLLLFCLDCIDATIVN